MKNLNGRTRTVEITLHDLPNTLPGRRELVMKQIQDPYDGKPIMAVSNVHESILERWMNTETICPFQYEAGHRFRGIWETARLGGARAIDYGRERVDGGLIADPISDRSMDATKELNAIAHYVGEAGYQRLIAVVGEGLGISQIAFLNGCYSKTQQDGFANIIRDLLSQLVKFFGLIGEGKRK